MLQLPSDIYNQCNLGIANVPTHPSHSLSQHSLKDHTHTLMKQLFNPHRSQCWTRTTRRALLNIFIYLCITYLLSSWYFALSRMPSPSCSPMQSIRVWMIHWKHLNIKKSMKNTNGCEFSKDYKVVLSHKSLIVCRKTLKLHSSVKFCTYFTVHAAIQELILQRIAVCTHRYMR